jgi:hypothetical protein
VNSTLSLVDLAGSERQSSTGAQGAALKESIEINTSLFVLRKVRRFYTRLVADHVSRK